MSLERELVHICYNIGAFQNNVAILIFISHQNTFSNQNQKVLFKKAIIKHALVLQDKKILG
jgi:hypothetical protein